MLMRWMLPGLFVVMAMPALATAQTPVAAAPVEAMLNAIADGHDPAFTEPVALAWSLTAGHSTADRVREINAQIAKETERVVAAFVNAPPDKKIADTKAVVAQIDPETAKDGAAYVFSGEGPSLAFFRQLLFVPVASAGANPADRVMQISSKFVASPKTEDYYYTYSDATNLKSSTVKELAGSGTSWTNGAQPSMASDTVYALKKCRDIFILGWYCNTSLYQVRDLPSTQAPVKLMLTALYAFPPGADNARFDDDRGKNVADGFSAIYVVLASGDYVLVYNVGAESANGSVSAQGSLSSALKTQYDRLASRFSAELGIAKLPF